MSSGSTTMRAGSLLDDNQWHDVEINRVGREVNFTVDRLTIMNMTNGDFYQLDLDRKVYLLGFVHCFCCKNIVIILIERCFKVLKFMYDILCTVFIAKI